MTTTRAFFDGLCRDSGRYHTLKRVARKALRELERLGALDNEKTVGKNKIYHALKRELERKAMNCPYCKKIVGLPLDTGLIEARKFQTHLSKCRKNPRNIVLRDGKRIAVGSRGVSLLQALEIRAESGQWRL